MINIEELAKQATAEEVSKCVKLGDNGYLVDGKYNVYYVEQEGFKCTCLCGKYNFRNLPQYCWHVRASVATWLAEEAAKEALREKISRQPTIVLKK